jgi:hypothetical protein
MRSVKNTRLIIRLLGCGEARAEGLFGCRDAYGAGGTCHRLNDLHRGVSRWENVMNGAVCRSQYSRLRAFVHCSYRE